jgi:hypothetical protein
LTPREGGRYGFGTARRRESRESFRLLQAGHWPSKARKHINAMDNDQSPAEEVPQTAGVNRTATKNFFDSIKSRLTDNRWIAVILFMGLIVTEIGHFASATLDIEKSLSIFRKTEFIQQYDDKLTDRLTDMIRQVIEFSESVQSGLIPITYDSHKQFYAKMKSEISVAKAIANAEGGQSPIRKAMIGTLSSLENSIGIWEKVDKEQHQVSTTALAQLQRQLEFQIGLSLSLAYATRSGQKDKTE